MRRKNKRLFMTFKRYEKGMTQKELAQKLGVSHQTISAIENGSRTPSGFLAKRIADELGFDMRKFYEEVNGIDDIA